MDLNDLIGMRGEIVFQMLITRWCEGTPWFTVTFLGEKAETKDFMVRLVEPTTGDAHCFVQVKGTTQGYSGKGKDRKLKAKVEWDDIEKLKQAPAPTFVVGIDVQGDKGYLVAITQETNTGFSAIPTTHPLNCHTIKRLWKEVNDHWQAREMLAISSQFSV